MALTIPRQDMAHLRSDSMTSFISGSLSGSHVAKQSSQTLAQAAQISTRSGLPRATSLAAAPHTSAQSMHIWAARAYSAFSDWAWRRQWWNPSSHSCMHLAQASAHSCCSSVWWPRSGWNAWRSCFWARASWALAPPPVMAASPAAVAPKTPTTSRRFIAILLLLRNMVLVATHPEWVTVLVASIIPQQFPARGFSLEKSPVFVFHAVNPLDTMLP